MVDYFIKVSKVKQYNNYQQQLAASITIKMAEHSASQGLLKLPGDAGDFSDLPHGSPASKGILNSSSLSKTRQSTIIALITENIRCPKWSTNEATSDLQSPSNEPHSCGVMIESRGHACWIKSCELWCIFR